MKNPLKIFICLMFTIAVSMSAAAQSASVSGDWDITITSPQGARTGKANFKQDGEKLTGTLTNPRGEFPLQGTVKGKEIKITYTVKFQDQELAITLTGNIDGDTMKGPADFGGFAQGDWSAKRATGAAAPSAAAASGDKVDISGSWAFEVETSQGTGNPSFNFKQDGEKLTGKYKGLLGEADLTGTVKGSQVEFSFKVSGQVEGTVIYTGTTDGKTMKGKVNLAGVGEGTFTGKKQ